MSTVGSSKPCRVAKHEAEWSLQRVCTGRRQLPRDTERGRDSSSAPVRRNPTFPVRAGASPESDTRLNAELQNTHSTALPR